MNEFLKFIKTVDYLKAVLGMWGLYATIILYLAIHSKLKEKQNAKKTNT